MNTPPAAGAPALSGNVLFYKDPQPLQADAHAGLGVRQIENPYAFMASANAIPVTVQEFGLAAGCYPLIFIGEELTPIAVMGVRQGENVFVSPEGQMPNDYYIPTFVRRYPFVFAADEASDRLILCVDRAAPMVTNQPEVKFFENGQPTQFTTDAIEFCKEFERQRRATAEFVAVLRELDLFETKSVTFQPRDQTGAATGPQQKIADYWSVSEERLNALPDDKYLELRNSGAIGAIYAHMVSLLNWQGVVSRAMRMPAPAAQAAPQPAV
ncbi:MAG: SapC family protein [Hyphomonas sp.]|nr:SapC family protein [Hyphomonas sp.]